MAAERIAMRQVRDVLRLKAAGVSGNEIARRVGMAFAIAIDESRTLEYARTLFNRK